MVTKRQRAVEVALDVLAQLRKRRNGYVATTGYYVETAYDLTEAGGDIRDHLAEIQGANCRVCALGAAVLSKARLYDNVPAEAFVDGDGGAPRESCTENLLDIFSQDQMDLIETAFECRDSREDGDPWGYNGTKLPARIARAIAFGERFKTPKARMRGIMQNIVENRGVFTPPVLVTA